MTGIRMITLIFGPYNDMQIEVEGPQHRITFPKTEDKEAATYIVSALEDKAYHVPEVL